MIDTFIDKQNAFIRDVTEVQIRPKSKVRRDLDELLTQLRQNVIEGKYDDTLE